MEKTEKTVSGEEQRLINMTYETKREPGTINKAFKYQLRPNKEQQGALAKAFGCVRFVYNYFLNLSIDTDKKNGKGLYYEDQAKLLVHVGANNR